MSRQDPRRRRRGRGSSPRHVFRWLAVAMVAFVAFLYYHPSRTYLETRAELERRSSEVDALKAEQRSLERRLAAAASLATLEREARRIGLVRPGERLFIVKGIAEWRRAHRDSASSR